MQKSKKKDDDEMSKMFETISEIKKDIHQSQKKIKL